jgi:hypothetical protein
MKKSMYNLVFSLKKKNYKASSRKKTVIINDTENVPKQALKLRDKYNFSLQTEIQ